MNRFTVGLLAVVGLHAIALAVMVQVGPTAGSLDTLPGFNKPGTSTPCEMWGNGTKPSPKGKSNAMKGRYVYPTQPDFYATGNFLTAVLSKTSLSQAKERARFNDQKAATLTGYVKAVKKGGIESCNCKNTLDEFRDTHIEVVANKADGPKKMVVVEPTPRGKHYVKSQGGDWSTTHLNSLKGKKVRFSGWIFFDDDHKLEAYITDPKNNMGRSNWRASCWELHPVTKIEVWDPSTSQWVDFH